MKQIITLILISYISIGLIYSQEIKYNESVENIYESSIRDFKELFYTELGIKERVYFNCSDTLFSNDCVIKRRLIYNEDGRIISDTSFIDTLFSSTNRIYLKDKIEIIKTHPEPSLFKYKYKTTIDSLIIDSLQRPVKYYEQGTLSRMWSYNNAGRLVCYKEKPDNTLFNKKSIYTYLPDTIIISKTNRSLSEFDTSYNFLIFDNKNRLVLDVSKGNSIKYKNIGHEVFLDSVVESNVNPEKVDVKYQYMGDTLIVIDNRLSLNQIVLLDSNKEIKSMKVIMNDTTVLGEYKFVRDKDRIIKKSFQNGELVRTEVQELRPNRQIKCKTVTSMNGKSFEKECYSEKGLILQKTSIYDGDYRENLICIDIKK